MPLAADSRHHMQPAHSGEAARHPVTPHLRPNTARKLWGWMASASDPQPAAKGSPRAKKMHASQKGRHCRRGPELHSMHTGVTLPPPLQHSSSTAAVQPHALGTHQRWRAAWHRPRGRCWRGSPGCPAAGARHPRCRAAALPGSPAGPWPEAGRGRAGGGQGRRRAGQEAGRGSSTCHG